MMSHSKKDRSHLYIQSGFMSVEIKKQLQRLEAQNKDVFLQSQFNIELGLKAPTLIKL